MTNFERALYADPDADHDAALVGARRAVPTRAPTATGATRPTGPPRSTCGRAPVYYHNYLYGQLVASQLAATLQRECGGIVGRRVAGRLARRSACSPRALSLRWDHLLEQATGEPLNAAHFVRDITV